MISLTSPVETRAHGWPAGLKLAGLAAATALLFWIKTPLGLAAAFAAILALYALPGRAFLRAGLSALRLVAPFAAILLIWQAFVGDVASGVAIALRMGAAVLAANLVTMVTPLEDLLDFLRWALTPLRRLGLPTHYVEIAIPLVLRFTPTLLERRHRLAEAWRARSTRRPGWRLFFPLTLSALDDADQVAEALKARGGLSSLRPPSKAKDA